MLAIGMLTIFTATTAMPPLTADFDGDGKIDTVAIVAKPDRSREIVVTFHDGRTIAVSSRVNEFTVLSIVSPEEIARACLPFRTAVAECSGKYLGHDRNGLAFQETRGGLRGMALWNGARFTTMFGMLDR